MPRPTASSLPPSSPPSTSSKNLNVDEPLNDEGDDDPDVSTASDPFGFFAVERKLKVLREQYRPPYKSPEPDYNADDSIEELYADQVPEIDASVIMLPTPEHQRLNMGATGTKLRDSSAVKPLSTPHKYKHRHSPLKRKPIASLSHSSTVPSTPSPSKRTGRVRAVDDDMKRAIDNDVSLTFDRDRDVDAGKENAPVSDLKEGKRAKRGVKKARPTTSMLDPKELAKGLEALLPRRPRRVGADVGGRVGKAVTAKGKTRVVDSSDDDVKNSKKVKVLPKRVVGKGKPPAAKKGTTRKATGKGKAAGKVKEEEGEHFGLDISGDEQEKLALERQARIEYFRKLDRYVVEKENVYVV